MSTVGGGWGLVIYGFWQCHLTWNSRWAWLVCARLYLEDGKLVLLGVAPFVGHAACQLLLQSLHILHILCRIVVTAGALPFSCILSSAAT